MADGDHRIDRDELLARTDLAQVLDALTTGHGHGRRRTWNCPEPEHPDVHPSVTIHTDSRGVQRWKCWSGGHGGTAIDAVLAVRRLPVGDAIRWLNDTYGQLEPVDREPPAPARPIGRPAPEVVEYVERCAKLLWTGSGREIRDWLNARGYGDEVLALNKVGADPGQRYLPRPKGFPGGWPAAVYPALDPSGAITYFQARYLNPPDGRGKYDNPGRHWATNPRIGWIRPAQGSTSARTPLVVTEGIADALTAGQLGSYAVGVLGAAAIHDMAARQIGKQLSRSATARGIVICFDADHAGRHHGHVATKRLLAAGCADVRAIRPPEGHDLTTWAATNPANATASLALQCSDSVEPAPLAAAVDRHGLSIR